MRLCSTVVVCQALLSAQFSPGQMKLTLPTAAFRLANDTTEPNFFFEIVELLRTVPESAERRCREWLG
jgi:hypothetical protein